MPVLGSPRLGQSQVDDPWEIWQEVDLPGVGPFVCCQCGQEKTGKRYVAINGPGAPGANLNAARNGIAAVTVQRTRAEGRVKCPECRWNPPKPKEQPKRRKTELD